jgi:hypothetical protein
VPYVVLSLTFEYPQVLRQETGEILRKFRGGGHGLIATWWVFALLGMPLLVALVRLGQWLENQFPFVRWATTLGIIGLLVQMVGLLLWPFVVPVLARHYEEGNAVIRQARLLAFEVVQQYGGVILGEHLGQLFTIIWTLALNRALALLGWFPRWVVTLDYVVPCIYVCAHLELCATVIPGFPVVPYPGLMGSSLRLAMFLAVGGILASHREGQAGIPFPG